MRTCGKVIKIELFEILQQLVVVIAGDCLHQMPHRAAP